MVKPPPYKKLYAVIAAVFIGQALIVIFTLLSGVFFYTESTSSVLTYISVMSLIVALHGATLYVKVRRRTQITPFPRALLIFPLIFSLLVICFLPTVSFSLMTLNWDQITTLAYIYLVVFPAAGLSSIVSLCMSVRGLYSGTSKRRRN